MSPAKQGPLWAEVCVNTPLGRTVGPSLGADRDCDQDARTFTYRIPERLLGRLQPGHLVWVPFRSRRLQAVVVEVIDSEPAFDTLEIEAVVWAQPVLTQTQLDLARWLSTYYLSPLIEALRLMLPARITQRGRTVLVRTREPEPADLTATQRGLLAQIARGEGTWAEVSEGLKVTQKADLEPLLQSGLVVREVAFANPPPRPKINRRVCLTADPEAIKHALPQLGRPSLEADILTWLSAQEDPSPALSALCRSLGCTPARARELAGRGRFTITGGRILLRSAAAGDKVPGVLQALAGVPRQAAVFAELAAGPVAEDELRARCSVSAATVRALVNKNLVERVEEPAWVSLALDRQTVPALTAQLRGADKHHRVLEALEKSGGTAWIGWVYAETGATLDTLRDLEAAGLIVIQEEMVWRDPLAGQEFHPDQPPALTDDQEQAWRAVLASIMAAHPPVPQGAAAHPLAFLLYGVTGSGKTEIYLRGIAEVLRRGQQAVVLVPEIALTPQTVQRFAARFPGQVTVWHSDLGDGERFDIWRRVRTGHPAAQVVVGSRSALFLPYPGLGLIVVDEEHESTYKQERTPRYHARAAAIELGRLAGAPVLLGSATPALETYFATRQGTIRLLTLPQRVLGHAAVAASRGLNQAPGPASGMVSAGARSSAPAAPHVFGDLPRAEIVDMRQELRAGNRTIFSRALNSALRRVLGRQEQAILYLNRRGSASFVMCRDCGHVESCLRCAVPLTYHGSGNTLLCHHCSRHYPVPALCPDCGSRRIRYFGSGTENVEEAVQQSFPGARTLRWDRDVTHTRGAHDALLNRFSAHQADILVGTQMIAKGLDLPLVTLVGIIAADTGIFLPDFRAGERTFQLLTQVAGRAGRSALGGQVIIQTYHPDHYAIAAAAHHDFEGFYRQEMVFRREAGYPPVRRLARLVFYHSQQAKAQAEAERVASLLLDRIDQLVLPEVDLVGPAPCFFTQQRGQYRWQIVVRAPDPTVLLRQVHLSIGWRVDVDPVDLL